MASTTGHGVAFSGESVAPLFGALRISGGPRHLENGFHRATGAQTSVRMGDQLDRGRRLRCSCDFWYSLAGGSPYAATRVPEVGTARGSEPAGTLCGPAQDHRDPEHQLKG